MEPLTWVYLALLAASTAASAKAQQKTNKARAQVAGEERVRRTKQQKASEASAQDTANQMQGLRDKEKERAAELTELYRKEAPTTTTTDAGTRLLSTDAPRQATSTVQGLDRARASAVAEENQRTKALADLGSFGDVFQQANIGAAHNAQDIGMEQGFMQGWQQNVLPALYNKANTAGRDWATAADVMKLAAAVTSFGALSGGGAAGANVGKEAAAGAAGQGAKAAASTALKGGGFAAPDIAAGASGVAGAGGGGFMQDMLRMLGIGSGAGQRGMRGGSGSSSGFVQSEAQQRALMKQAQGMPLTAEEQLALMGTF